MSATMEKPVEEATAATLKKENAPAIEEAEAEKGPKKAAAAAKEEENEEEEGEGEGSKKKGKGKRKRAAAQDKDSDEEDEEEPAGKGKGKEKGGGKGKGKAKGGPKHFELGNKRIATVSVYQGKLLVDLREYYLKDKDDETSLAPGKKGISLSVEQLERLKAITSRIDAALEALED